MKALLPALGCSLLLACSSDDTAAPATGSGGAPDGSADVVEAGEADADADATDPELDAKCTPTFTLQLEDVGPKGQLFTNAVPDPEAFVQETGREVCRILYRNADEVRDVNHITLIIRDDPDYPGWKSGSAGDITVMISTYHLAALDAKGGDVLKEIKGVLLHEMTHMYQHDDAAAGEATYPNLGNVIEGVADFVRIRAKYPPVGAKPSKTGVWDDAGYWKPAFFLLWVDGKHQDFVYRLNLSMKGGDGVAWAPAAFEKITSATVDELWAEYLGAACCSGSTQTCCK